MLVTNLPFSIPCHKEERWKLASTVDVLYIWRTTGSTCRKSPPKTIAFTPEGRLLTIISFNKRSNVAMAVLRQLALRFRQSINIFVWLYLEQNWQPRRKGRFVKIKRKLKNRMRRTAATRWSRCNFSPSHRNHFQFSSSQDMWQTAVDVSLAGSNKSIDKNCFGPSWSSLNLSLDPQYVLVPH